MIEHLALFQWKPNASQREITRVLDELRALKGQISGIQGLCCINHSPALEVPVYSEKVAPRLKNLQCRRFYWDEALSPSRPVF